MTKNRTWIVIFLLPTVLLFILIFAAALVILLGTSFTDWRIGSKIVFAGLKNYSAMIFKDADFIDSLVNTLVWVILSCTVHVLTGVIFALILAKKEFYWKFARTVYMIPNVISGAAWGMLFLVMLNPEFGAVDAAIRSLGFKDFSLNWFMNYNTAFFSVSMMWIPYAAVVTILVLTEIASIPDSILESSKIDGANEFQTNLYIIIPMLKNIIGTCMIISGTSVLQKLDVIMMTTGGGPGNKTISLPIYLYRTALIENNFGYANTIGVSMIVIGIFLVLFITRMFNIGNSQT